MQPSSLTDQMAMPIQTADLPIHERVAKLEAAEPHILDRLKRIERLLERIFWALLSTFAAIAFAALKYALGGGSKIG